MKEFYPISRPSLGDKESSFLMHAIASGWISSIGEFISRFEADFAEFCECKHAIAVSNGTTALHLALYAMNVGRDDEVIVPDLSFIATANTVLQCGATPVFADVEEDTLCMDFRDLRRRITPRTKAIIPVHLYGHPANMAAINSLAREHGLKVIEDAAEAHGAICDGRRVGGIGDCGTFSFYANKILTTGEGGMITTNDDAFAERCRMLRDHSMSRTKRYWHEEAGFNYRLTNMQAAIGCAQMERSSELVRKRAKIFRWYSNELAGLEGVSLNYRAPWAEPSYWMICVNFLGIDLIQRGHLMARLKECGVDSRPYFFPMSDMPYFESSDTPIAHAVFKRGINLPTYFDLSEDDVRVICGVLRNVWSEL